MRPDGSSKRRSSTGRLRTLGAVRFALLTSLALEPRTAIELADELSLPLEKVRYQLRRLNADGAIQVHGEHQRRGMVEKIYIADPRRNAELETQLVAEATDARRIFQRALLTTLFRELLEAIQAGAFHERLDYTLAFVPLALDPRGHDEVEEIVVERMERMFAIREECLRRLERTDEPRLAAISAFLHLEQKAQRG